MIELWRLSNYETLEGGCLAASRWHEAGAPVVSLDASPAAALLARLALAEIPHPAGLPRGYALLKARAPREAVLPVCAPPNWLSDIRATRKAGGGWLADALAPILEVPAPGGGSRYLLNLAHPAASWCRIDAVLKYPYEPYLSDMERAVRSGASWLVVPDGGRC